MRTFNHIKKLYKYTSLNYENNIITLLLLINSKDIFIKLYQFVIMILIISLIRMIMQFKINGKIMRMPK